MNYYKYLLLLIVHFSFFPTPICYFPLHQQATASPYRYGASLSYGKKQQSLCSYDNQNRLLTCSSAELKSCFEDYAISETSILSQKMLFLSDEFVQLAKTYQGYEAAITDLYEKIKRMSAVSKFFHKLFGPYSARYFERIFSLYKELQLYKQCVNDKTISFAHGYDIKLLEFLPNSSAEYAQCIYQDYMQILTQAFYIPNHNSIARDCIGNACQIGLEANK